MKILMTLPIKCFSCKKRAEILMVNKSFFDFEIEAYCKEHYLFEKLVRRVSSPIYWRKSYIKESKQ